MVRVAVKNSTHMNQAIDKWLSIADTFVTKHLNNGLQISADELKNELNKVKKGDIEVKTSVFLDHYSKYLIPKQMQLVERENKLNESYGTFRSTIEDSEAEH
jgi:hypothetical protein